MDILEVICLDQPNILVDENGTGYLVEGKINNAVTFISVFYEVIRKLFILFFVFVGAGSIAFITISLSVYNDIKEYNKFTERIREGEGDDGEGKGAGEEEESEEEFLEKYLQEYDTLEERKMNEIELGDLKNLYIEEKTPRGNVIMSYNNITGAFEYYSNTKDLPYSYLEVVGRSYVIKYLCKELLIDTKSEIDKAKKIKEKNKVEGAGIGVDDKTTNEVNKVNEVNEVNKVNKVNEVNKVNKVNEKVSVFARFKNYNTDTKKESTKLQKSGDSNENKESNEVILLERSNHYVYKGKLEDYEKEHRNDEDSTEEFEHLDYNTFKNLSMDEKKNL